MFFAVCLEERVIGYIVFHIRKDGYEIGYCFHSAYHGKGYAKESHLALFEYMQTLGITRFSAGTAINDVPSVKLLTSLGFKLVDREKVSFYKDAMGKDIVFDGGVFEMEYPIFKGDIITGELLMRVAVLSDIHSNYHAFQACYEDAVKRGADMFIFLGDYVSDLAEPAKTMDLVYEIRSCYPTVCLRGNREGYMLDCEKGISSFVRGSKSGSLLFTYDHLRKKDLNFFSALKISDTIKIDGITIEIAHASMDNDRYYFDCNDGHTAEIFPQMKYKYLLTGHSHKQYIKQDHGKTIINPGSVGIPQDGTQRPKYAILEIANGDVTCAFHEVSYNMADVIHAQFASGLVDYAKYWAIGVLYDMITGEDWVLKLLKRVQEADGIYDEDAWHSAAAKLGMKFTEREILEWYMNE